ncbi:uncharacterized protein LOC144104546 [Amblyomma americanum]
MPNTRCTLSGFSPEYDWKPTEFEDPIDANRICASCRVLTRGTALLGCCHALCEPCYATTLRRGQRCPIDDTAYAEGEVQWLSTSVEQIEGLQVKCWNARRGCPFVTTLSEMPSHFYQKCRFQTVICDRCSIDVLRSSMLDHRKVCGQGDATMKSNGAVSVSDASGFSKLAGDSEKSPGLSLAEVVDFQYNLETKINSLVEHVHNRDATGVSKSELLTATVGLLRSIGLLSLSATWRPQGLAVVVSRVRYFMRQTPQYAEEVYSAPFNVCGYSLRLGVRCERKLPSPAKSCDCTGNDDLVLKFMIQLCTGAKNSALHWPFRKSLTLSVVHPQDSTKEVRFFLNTSMMATQPSFQIPGPEDNPPFNIGGPLHVAALAGCQFWSYGTLQLRLGMALSSGERDEGN